jgi:hypothetical protein
MRPWCWRKWCFRHGCTVPCQNIFACTAGKEDDDSPRHEAERRRSARISKRPDEMTVDVEGKGVKRIAWKRCVSIFLVNEVDLFVH